MTFWQFLDRQLGRVRPSGVAGGGIFLLTFVVLWMVKTDPQLADNDLFKTLSQAIVVQGLVGLAMAAWFTKNDRAAARPIEGAAPTGRPDDPVSVEEVS